MTIEEKIYADLQARSAEKVAAAQAEAAKIAEVQAGEKEQKAAEVAFKAIGKNREGLIIGIGAAAGSANKVDLDGEFVSKSDLVKMAHDFTSGQRVFKANHKEEIDAKLVRSWVGAPIIADGEGVRTLKADEVLTDEMEVVGIDIRQGNESHWFVGSQLPKTLADKADDVAGFSFGAAVTKVQV